MVMYTVVYTCTVRVHGRLRLCTRRVHGLYAAVYTVVYTYAVRVQDHVACRVHVYTAVKWPCTGRTHVDTTV